MAWLITIGMALCKGFYFFNIQGQNVTKLAQKTTDHIGHLSVLPNGKVAGTMDRENGLPVFGFGKPHC